MSLTEILTALGVLANTVWIIYSSWKRNKPEVKKLEIEADSEIVDAANLNLEGAKISAQMLLDRINELKGELDTEKANSRARIEQLKTSGAEEIARIEKSRKTDADYFRRRIKDLERESRDYRSWAAKLVKQVVEAGKVPVPFVPSFGESETGMTAIRTDLETDDNGK
jgi:uncharacterized protein involved in exopolysaccharide biosynthesis